MSTTPDISDLPPEVKLQILRYMTAIELSKCAGLSREWQGYSNQELLWKELCRQRWSQLRHTPFMPHIRVDYSDPRLTSGLSIAELKGILARRGGKLPKGILERVDIVRQIQSTRPAGSPAGRWTGVWKSSYIVAELDLTRRQLSFQEVSSLEWKFEVWTQSANHDPIRPWRAEDFPNAHEVTVRFLPDGTYSNKALHVERLQWRMTAFGGVQVEEYPPHHPRRTKDGGWVMSNGYFTYRSIHNGSPSSDE
ncbi:hypothetical protein DFS34DRAFT_673770 [Phlyctochytrium arcticum]|nr:hypothetical protein DFS34DRAFT_673770 [Phlyctochytrium arcticum]